MGRGHGHSSSRRLVGLGAACGEGGEGGASLHSGHCVHGVEMVSV